jgi:hypothetical protein
LFLDLIRRHFLSPNSKEALYGEYDTARIFWVSACIIKMAAYKRNYKQKNTII